MKRILSLAIVLTMILAIVPFSAFSTSVSADSVNYSNNLALDKPFEVSITNKGITSAYHPIKCNGSVTDGHYNNTLTAGNINNNTWLAVQNYTNCIPLDQGSLGYEAEIIIDLGAIYDIGEVKVHFANGKVTLSDGYVMTSDIELLDIYTSLDHDFGYSPMGKNNVASKKGANWVSATDDHISARYIKVNLWLNDATTDVIYGLIDEVEVYGYSYEIEYTNYAKNANYKIYDFYGNLINPTRGYTGDLNDGIYDVPVVTQSKNPLTGAYNCNNGDWFGLFDNAATTEQNCADGIAYIWFDLGAVKSVDDIRVFAAYGYEPGFDAVYYSMDNVNFEATMTLFDCDVLYEYGAWWSTTKTFQCRYVIIKVYVESYWAIFNEVEINGHAVSNLAAGKSYNINCETQDEFKYARGYTGDLTDGIADVPLISYLPNPVTGKNNCNDGNYLGFFNNPYAPDERNAYSDSSFIVIDLGQVCEIAQIKAFFAAGYETETYVSFSNDGVNYYDETYLNGLEFTGNGNWETASVSTYGRYVKVEFVYYDAIWCLVSEVVVNGNPV